MAKLESAGAGGGGIEGGGGGRSSVGGGGTNASGMPRLLAPKGTLFVPKRIVKRCLDGLSKIFNSFRTYRLFPFCS